MALSVHPPYKYLMYGNVWDRLHTVASLAAGEICTCACEDVCPYLSNLNYLINNLCLSTESHWLMLLDMTTH